MRIKRLRLGGTSSVNIFFSIAIERNFKIRDIAKCTINIFGGWAGVLTSSLPPLPIWTIFAFTRPLFQDVFVKIS